jgi:hypothetical protein
MAMAQLDAENPGGLPDISMVFKSENTPDPRRYNAPTNSTEIGILILESGSRDVALRLRDNNNNDIRRNGNSCNNTGSSLQIINDSNKHYDQCIMFFSFLREILDGLWAHLP